MNSSDHLRAGVRYAGEILLSVDHRGDHPTRRDAILLLPILIEPRARSILPIIIEVVVVVTEMPLSGRSNRR